MASLGDSELKEMFMLGCLGPFLGIAELICGEVSYIPE